MFLTPVFHSLYKLTIKETRAQLDHCKVQDAQQFPGVIIFDSFCGFFHFKVILQRQIKYTFKKKMYQTQAWSVAIKSSLR